MSEKCIRTRDVSGNTTIVVSGFVGSNTQNALANGLNACPYLKPKYENYSWNGSSYDTTSSTVESDYTQIKYPLAVMPHNRIWVESETWQQVTPLYFTDTGTSTSARFHFSCWGSGKTATASSFTTGYTSDYINNPTAVDVLIPKYWAYSYNGVTWSALGFTTSGWSGTRPYKSSDTLYFASSSTRTIYFACYADPTSNGMNRICRDDAIRISTHFDSCTGINVGGNIDGLTRRCTNWGHVPFSGTTSSDRNGYHAFLANAKIKSYGGEALTAQMKGSPGQYCATFQNTSITQIPVVAIVGYGTIHYIGRAACQQMFGGCTGLTVVNSPFPYPGTSKFHMAPAYAGSKYYVEKQSLYLMFRGCTNMTKIGDIYVEQSGTTSIQQVCYGMFSGCTSLRTAPRMRLWETNTSISNENEYAYMFEGCTSLQEITYLPDPPALSFSGTSGPFYKWADLASYGAVYTYGQGGYNYTTTSRRLITRGYFTSNTDLNVQMTDAWKGKEKNFYLYLNPSATIDPGQALTRFYTVYGYSISSIQIRYSGASGTQTLANTHTWTYDGQTISGWKIPVTSATQLQTTKLQIQITFTRDTYAPTTNAGSYWPANFWLRKQGGSAIYTTHLPFHLGQYTRMFYHEDGSYTQDTNSNSGITEYIAVSSGVTTGSSNGSMTYTWGAYQDATNRPYLTCNMFVSSINNWCGLAIGFGLFKPTNTTTNTYRIGYSTNPQGEYGVLLNDKSRRINIYFGS